MEIDMNKFYSMDELQVLIPEAKEAKVSYLWEKKDGLVQHDWQSSTWEAHYIDKSDNSGLLTRYFKFHLAEPTYVGAGHSVGKASSNLVQITLYQPDRSESDIFHTVLNRSPSSLYPEAKAMLEPGIYLVEFQLRPLLDAQIIIDPVGCEFGFYLEALERLPFTPPLPIQLGQQVSGSWDNGTVSEHTPGSFAKYFTLSLSQETTVKITARSGEQNIDLFLLDGPNMTSHVLVEQDQVVPKGDYDTFEIVRKLAPGNYMIEVATWDREQTGSFTLRVDKV